jgi:hypothetical protein
VIGGGEGSRVGAAGAIRSCPLLPRNDKEPDTTTSKQQTEWHCT